MVLGQAIREMRKLGAKDTCAIKEVLQAHAEWYHKRLGSLEELTQQAQEMGCYDNPTVPEDSESGS